MKGFRILVCTALCSALMALMSACLPSGGTGDGDGGNNGTVSDETGEYENNNDKINLPEIATDADDINAQFSLADVTAHTMKDGEVYTVQQGGTYLINGTATNARIEVRAKGERVRLVLDGVNIINADSAAIDVNKAEKCIITLAAGSENTLTDGETYALDQGEDEPSAALFCKGALTINGEGKLTVNARYNNGIQSKSVMRIMGGDITVIAAGDGIAAKDGLLIADGNVIINSADDGIKLTGRDEGRGSVNFAGGKVDITSGGDGVQAENQLSVTGGEISITAGCGADAVLNEADSAKGLKSAAAVVMGSGRVIIDSADDGLHSDKDIALAGGGISVESGDDGIHADGSVTLSGAVVNVLKSYEGVEGQTVNIDGGKLYVNASDDGINATHSSGGDAFTPAINISGGYTVVSAGGDGLDSNGNITMSGGTVLVYCGSGGSDAALDYDKTFLISGGTLIAAGPSGMAQTPSANSSVNTLHVRFNSTQTAGRAINIRGGDLDLTVLPPVAFSSLVISSPMIESGESYTVSCGGDAQEEKDGVGKDYSGGTVLAEVTVTSSVTNIGFGGSWFPGGGGSRPDDGRPR